MCLYAFACLTAQYTLSIQDGILNFNEQMYMLISDDSCQLINKQSKEREKENGKIATTVCHGIFVFYRKQIIDDRLFVT